MGGADPDKTIDILSNLTPQRASLNSGIWARLEAAERRLLDGPVTEVFSLTGPIFAPTAAGDPDAGLHTTKTYRVPLKYWKVIGVRTASG